MDNDIGYSKTLVNKIHKNNKVIEIKVIACLEASRNYSGLAMISELSSSTGIVDGYWHNYICNTMSEILNKVDLTERAFIQLNHNLQGRVDGY